MKGKNNTCTIVSDLMEREGYCDVHITSPAGTMIHHVCGVNYGLAITNIMEEWNCSSLKYTPKTRQQFLADLSCFFNPNLV